MRRDSVCFASGAGIRFVYLILLAMSVLSCGPANDKVLDIRSINRGLSSEPETLDPHLFSSSEAAKVIRDTREGLITYSSDGSLVGGVASEWNISEDGLIYQFTLRHDAHWSNGERVVAADFVRGFQRVIGGQIASPWAEDLRVIENAASVTSGDSKIEALGVDAKSTDQLEIRLERPVPYFLQLLAHPSTFPYREAGQNDPYIESGDSTQLVNGPFVVSSRSMGSALALNKNQYYWDAKNVWFDSVTYHVHDPAGEVRRFRAGELDVTSSVDSASFPMLQQERAAELRVSPSLNVYFYAFNMRDEPFRSDTDLRRALAMSIDREKLVASVTRRGEIPAYGFVPPNVDNYESQVADYATLTQLQRDSQAKKRLSKSHFGTSTQKREIELLFNSGGGHESIAVAIQSMWRNVLGVTIKLKAEEFKVFIDNVRARRGIDMFRLSWKADYNDASSFLQLFHSENPNNLTGYASEEVDSLLDAAEQSNDPKEREILLQRVERLVLSDQIVVPIYFFVNKHLVRQDIRGWEDNSADIHLSRYLKRESADRTSPN